MLLILPTESTWLWQETVTSTSSTRLHERLRGRLPIPQQRSTRLHGRPTGITFRCVVVGKVPKPVLTCINMPTVHGVASGKKPPQPRASQPRFPATVLKSFPVCIIIKQTEPLPACIRVIQAFKLMPSAALGLAVAQALAAATTVVELTALHGAPTAHTS